jgi:hypothetical protein
MASAPTAETVEFRFTPQQLASYLPIPGEIVDIFVQGPAVRVRVEGRNLVFVVRKQKSKKRGAK